MSSEKADIVVPPPAKIPCPVCGKASYSPGGIHPQSAMQLADEPRLARLTRGEGGGPQTDKTPSPELAKEMSGMRPAIACVSPELRMRAHVCQSLEAVLLRLTLVAANGEALPRIGSRAAAVS